MIAVFLIGAGFNADATAEAGPIYGHSIDIGRHQIQYRYPLLADLPRICFERESLAPDESVEHLLAEAQDSGEKEPFERLAREIMRADYYLVPELTREDSHNCYARFFNCFETAQFLTFNYDALVDLFLLRRGRWCPDDGYGVPVLAGRSQAAQPSSGSKSLVLHLHGTFCLYISDHQFVDRTGSGIEWYEDVNPPRYIFDPHSISNLFHPYRRTPPTFGYEPFERRVVAPVPDKTTGLQGQFVQRMYQLAQKFLASADVLVAIGYGFGPTDEASYMPLLKALQRAKAPRLLIVDPAARSIAARLRPRVLRTDVCALDWTLNQWVERDCPLTSADVGV